MDSRNVTDAAKVVLSALEPLQPDERERVLQAARALYGSGSLSPAAAGPTPPGTRARSAIGPAALPAGIDPESGSLPSAEPAAKRLSLVEFLGAANPATNPQRIAAFAYYREHVEGKTRFARGDLTQYFAASKQALPQNYDRDFTKAIRTGWIHEDGPNSYITGAGEEAVKGQFLKAKAK